MDLVLPGLDHAETILDFMFVCFSFNTIYIYILASYKKFIQGSFC